MSAAERTQSELTGVSIWIAYRMAPPGKPEVRPAWYSPEGCLTTFLAALDEAKRMGLSCDVHFVLDCFRDSEFEARMSAVGDVHLIEVRGNSRSFRAVLSMAQDTSAEYVFLVEDDYVWTRGAITEAVLALRRTRADYASPYAHPFRSRLDRQDSVRHRSRVLASGAETTWYTTPQTTMTFVCAAATLRRDALTWRLASFGQAPKDGYAFEAILSGRVARLIGNAGFRDWRRIARIDVALLALSCLGRRLARKPRFLIQAEPGLAVHAHEPYLSWDRDWGNLFVSRDDVAPRLGD